MAGDRHRSCTPGTNSRRGARAGRPTDVVRCDGGPRDATRKQVRSDMSTLIQQVLDADASGSEVRLLGMFLAEGARPATPRDFARAPFEPAAAVRVSASLFHDA